MKKLLVILMISSALLAQGNMSVFMTDNLIGLKISGPVVKTNFTPGADHGNTSVFNGDTLSFKKEGDIYSTTFSDFSRGMAAGKIQDVSLYNFSAGYVPRDLRKPLHTRVSFSKGKTLIWCGESFTTQVEQNFSSYFVAREFPLVLVPTGKYIKRVSHFTKRDSMNVFYVWEDSLTKAVLPTAFGVVDSAADIIGRIFPKYLRKIINYGGHGYSLVIIINKKIVTALEHFNAPYIVTVPQYITVGGVLHTLLHSFIGKSVIPSEYMRPDGKFYPSDALGFYEGLVTFLSLKYERNFSARLAGTIFRAKINPECSDLTKVSVCGAGLEKWYADGYLFCLYLQSLGLNMEEFTHWLYEDELFLRPVFPIQIHWSDVLGWLSKYNPEIGKVASEVYKGDYISLAFDTLKVRGWSPIPVWKIPRWYDFYIGPYPLDPNGVVLPTDNYPAGHPMYLLNAGKKMHLKAETSNPALMLIKSHPDSIFNIEFSDGSKREVENKVKFSDGSWYSMHCIIGINESNKRFWHELNIYF